MSEASVARANAVPEPEMYRCLQCGSRLLTASGLAHHVAEVHKARPKPARKIVSAVSGKVVSVATTLSGSGISGRLLAKVQLQGGLCYWCNAPFRYNAGPDHELAPTREHGLPKSLGGTKILAIVHRRCNAIRGVIDAEAFGRLMRGEAVTKGDLWPHLFGRDDD